MADAGRQAFGRMCLEGRFREQARSHMGGLGSYKLCLAQIRSADTTLHQSGSHPFNTNRIIVCAAAS